MKRHASPISAALLLTVGLLVLSTSTALADAKVYQADALCRGPLVPDLSTGALINISSINAVSVYCGIPRDRTDAKPTAVQVTVVDNSSLLIGDGNFNCFLTPISRAGVAGTPAGSVGTSGTNSAGVTLTVPIPAVVSVDGTLTLKCRIPRRGSLDPSSRLTLIKIVEADPTN